MYIYNVTVSIEKTISEDWLNWMKTVHIPDVLKTGFFTGNRIYKVLHVNDEGDTYSIQYLFKAISDIETYQKQDAPRLQAEHTKRYEGKYVAFRTILEVID